MKEFNLKMMDFIKKLHNTNIDPNLYCIIACGSYGFDCATHKSDLELLYLYSGETYVYDKLISLALSFNFKLLALNDYFSVPINAIKMDNVYPHETGLRLDFGGITPFGRIMYKDGKPFCSYELIMTPKQFYFYLKNGSKIKNGLPEAISFGKKICGSDKLYNEAYNETNFKISQSQWLCKGFFFNFGRCEYMENNKLTSKCKLNFPIIMSCLWRNQFNKCIFYRIPQILYSAGIISLDTLQCIALTRYVLDHPN